MLVSCVVRLHQPVDMDHEIAHLGIVHRGLGLGAPGAPGLGELGYMPTMSSLARSLNSMSSVRLQLAAEHQMQKLFGVVVVMAIPTADAPSLKPNSARL